MAAAQGAFVLGRGDLQPDLRPGGAPAESTGLDPSLRLVAAAGAAGHHGPDMASRAHRPIAPALAGIVAGWAILVLAATPAAAEDPTPEATPTVFARPQYLIHWGWHHTYNGPVKDDSYGLFTQPAIETGSFPGPDGSSGSEHFTVPDGNAGVYHYFGETIGGPFTSDEELCEIVIGTTLPQTYEVWPPGSGIADCRDWEFVDAATPTPPAPAATDAPGGGGTTDGSNSGTSGGTSGEDRTDEALDIAAGLIGLILFGGGLAGLAGGRAGGSATKPKPTATARPAESPPTEPVDPCEAQMTAYSDASDRAFALQDAAQNARRFEAVVDQQVARLANWTIPMTFGVDLGFIVGTGLGGKLGWGWAPKHLAGKFVDGMGKELLKGLGKIGLGIDEAKLIALTQQGLEGGAKNYLKLVIEDGLASSGAGRALSRLPGAIPPRAPGGMTPDLSMASRLRSEIASPMADIVGHLMSVYNTTMSVGALVNELDIVRLKARELHDATTSIELQLEDALEAQRFAADRLDHCRALYDEEYG